VGASEYHSRRSACTVLQPRQPDGGAGATRPINAVACCPPQTDTVGKMQAAVYILLKTTPPNGDKFTDAVRRVLASEHEWVKWKNESCPDFFRDSVELRKRKSPGVGEVGGGEAKKAKGAGERDLGSAELSRLWSLSETNLDGCESAVESGRFIPDVGSYFKEAIEQVNESCADFGIHLSNQDSPLSPWLGPVCPCVRVCVQVAGANPVDKRFWVFTDQTDYNWRALRLLGKDRLHYFQVGFLWLARYYMQEEDRKAPLFPLCSLASQVALVLNEVSFAGF
jgi:hypothetical protein